ncbi:hypothetical protein [Undibacterium sp. YM2]|uniref:hypothetical protein n=1 Tax=Undibacterium sp. YM2 TaxID=2058625 RepID=UPI001389C8B2|nr:hypothetical protein [Undibacterium sp. YM2]
MSFLFSVFLPFYALPFCIMAFMPSRRALSIAGFVLGLPIIAFTIFAFREVSNPDNNASSFGTAILMCSVALVSTALVAGAITRLILLRRQTVVASPRVRAGIMLGGFLCLPVLLAVLVI